jgi:hypothetical protein
MALIGAVRRIPGPCAARDLQAAIHQRTAAARCDCSLPTRMAAPVSSRMSRATTMEVDPASLRRSYVHDESVVVPVGLFVKGPAYKLWGLIPADRHLIGPLQIHRYPVSARHRQAGPGPLEPADLWHPHFHVHRAASASASACCWALRWGPLAGFYGGRGRCVDTARHRGDLVDAHPFRSGWAWRRRSRSPGRRLTVYFVITLIVSLFGWTGWRARCADASLPCAARIS